jgi:hypothetical protein
MRPGPSSRSAVLLLLVLGVLGLLLFLVTLVFFAGR